MLFFTCSECGEALTSLDTMTEQECPGCGAKVTADSGLRISLGLVHEDLGELGDEIADDIADPLVVSDELLG